MKYKRFHLIAAICAFTTISSTSYSQEEKLFDDSTSILASCVMDLYLLYQDKQAEEVASFLDDSRDRSNPYDDFPKTSIQFNALFRGMIAQCPDERYLSAQNKARVALGRPGITGSELSYFGTLVEDEIVFFLLNTVMN